MPTTPLHPTTTHTTQMPRYVQRFRCTGAACEDSCCAGWHIPIDERTFHAYTGDAAPAALRPRLAQALQLEAAPRPQRHARIALDATSNACPLGVVWSRRRHGACTALRWSDEHQRYLCGALALPWLAPLARRWIAAGQGCDATLSVDNAPP